MAKMIDYVCTHCGRNFQAEEREIVECPGCFWSTSVKKKEDAVREESAGLKSSGEEKRPSFSFGWLKPALLAAAGIAVLVLVLPRLGGLMQSLKPSPKPSASEVPAEKGPAPAAQPGAAPAAGPETITSEDEQMLASRVSLDAAREPAPREKEILEADVPFRTGFVEKLPSPAWSLENQQKMVAEQEAFYKITFPRSYKKKLEELFNAQYAPAMDAFLAGDLLKARDMWVASLAYPLYSQDLRKHRGVALTMLRPLINDTLSKIGALNQMIVEQQLRAREEAISAGYQQLREKLGARAWAEAVRLAEGLEAQIDELEKVSAQENVAPDYAQSAAAVDQDIMATLMDILTPARPAVADLRPMRADIRSKKEVAESFLPERVREQAGLYDRALSFIASQNWKEARETLQQIRFPAPLVEDAQAKIRVLEKKESQ